MSRKIVGIVALVAIAGLGIIPGLARARTGSVEPTATPVPGCRSAVYPGTTVSKEPSSSWASVGGSLARLSPDGVAVRLRLDQGSGVVRHVAVAGDGRSGVAYVRHGRSRDAVVVVGPAGVRTIREHGEVLHPAWSSRGDLVWSTRQAIRMLDANSGTITTVAPPRRGASVYSPVFATSRRLVVSAAPATKRWTADGDGANDLWSYDRASKRWHRLTRFKADGARWTAVRTPVRVAPGLVEFVRIRGDASRTVAPRFELWQLEHGHASRVRVLPGERYLAGLDASGRRLWNVPDAPMARMDLAVEGKTGGLITIGCGAILADPIDVPDPSRSAAGGAALAREGWLDLDDHEHDDGTDDGTDDDEEESEVDDEEYPLVPLSIVVGDFARLSQARAAAAAIEVAYGPNAPVEVVDGDEMFMLIERGYYGAVLRLPDDADPIEAIEAFRSRLSTYEGSSWVVTS